MNKSAHPTYATLRYHLRGSGGGGGAKRRRRVNSGRGSPARVQNYMWFKDVKDGVSAIRTGSQAGPVPLGLLEEEGLLCMLWERRLNQVPAGPDSNSRNAQRMLIPGR